MDGLRAEREQGITIDVAYRGFVTPRRRFQLADAPGHVQYTRNMVTGASTADLAVILVDARKGVVEQTRRHAYVLSMLELPHVVFAVNKMDLVEFSEERFDDIARDLAELAARLGMHDVARDPDLGAQGRQRRRPVGRARLVRGADAARAPRDGRGRRRSLDPRRAASRCSG